MLSPEKHFDILKLDNTRLLDKLNDSILFVDRMGNIVFMNRAFKDKFNKGADVIQIPIQKVFPNIKFDFSKKHNKFQKLKTLYQGMEWELTITKVEKDHDHIGAWVIIREAVDYTGCDQHLTFPVNTRVFDSITDALAVVDRNFKIVYINRTFADLLGFKPEELHGQDCRPLLKGIEKYVRNGVEEGMIDFDTSPAAGDPVEIMIYPLGSGRAVLLISNGRKLFNAFQYKVRILNSKIAYYQEQLAQVAGARYKLENVIGSSQQVKILKENIKKMACSNCTVLLRGEKGSGKELMARVLHSEGTRKFGPFVKVKCSFLSKNADKNELFFTESFFADGDPASAPVGKLALADKGTIFLEDIADLSLEVQKKLLQFLQTKKICGADGKEKEVDVRIIAATSRNLEELVKRDLFLEHLYYRLNVLSFCLPPLRDRQEDILPLFLYFVKRYAEEAGIVGQPKIPPETYELLFNHDWPGNVDELKEIAKQTVNSLESPVVAVEKVPVYLNKVFANGTGQLTLKQILDKTEKLVLMQTLQRTAGNKVKAAKMLGISRAGLYQKLEKHSLLDE